MKIAEIIFSPTGGTQKVADIIANELNEEIRKIDLTDSSKNFESITLENDDVAIIAIPSYGGRVPALATERIKKLHGNKAKAILVCVYGNRAYEDTLVELNDVAEECGFQVIAAISAVAEHSIMHQYATARPDDADKAELQNFAKQISEKLNNGSSETKALNIPGNRPYKKLSNGGFVPKAGKDCVNCGLCAKKCPAQAIDTSDCKKVDKSKCISCMRCISVCPHSARSLNKAIVSAASLVMKKACSQRKGNELFI